MKRYIKSTDQLLTESDYKAALLLMKNSANEGEVKRAQEVIREYKAQNPELADKAKSEFNAKRPRTPRSKTPKDPRYFTTDHIRW